MKQAADIVAIMFLSREQAHRAHLLSSSYSEHMALGDFYEGIIEIADDFAETCQGYYGKFDVIPSRLAVSGKIDAILEKHLALIESLRDALDGKRDRPLQNIIDTACALYARTLYKLRELS